MQICKTKAREAMIAAVHTFNSAGLTFRAELFIVTAIIAWTYLLHTWFKREGIDYRNTRTEKGEMDSHTKLWQRLAAKDPAKGYGAVAVGNQWGWYETWLNRVREECQQHPDRYRRVPPHKPTTF